MLIDQLDIKAFKKNTRFQLPSSFTWRRRRRRYSISLFGETPCTGSLHHR